MQKKITLLIIAAACSFSCSSKMNEQKNKTVAISKVISIDTIMQDDTNQIPILKGKIFELPSMDAWSAEVTVSNETNHYVTYSRLLENIYYLKIPKQGSFSIKYSSIEHKDLIIENFHFRKGRIYLIDVGLTPIMTSEMLQHQR